MASFEGRNGPWAVATDVICLDPGASKKATRHFGIGRIELPVSVDANRQLEVTRWVCTLEGSYATVRRIVGFWS